MSHIGYRTVIDAKTGEEHTLAQIVREPSDSNFQKMFTEAFMDKIEANKSRSANLLKVLFMLINVMDHENQVAITQADMATLLDVSKRTVVRLVGDMMDMDFLEKIRNGLYMLNPEFVAVVKRSQRKKLFDRYTQYKANRLEEERQKQKREEAKKQRQTTIDEQISRSA